MAGQRAEVDRSKAPPRVLVPGRGQCPGLVDGALLQLAEGAEPTPPERAPRSDDAPAPPAERPDGPYCTYGEYARAWHHEYYVLLHGGQAERSKDVLRDIEKHLLPAFDGPLPTDVQEGRRQVIAGTRRMAGYPPEPDEPGNPGASGLSRTYATKSVNGLL